MTTATIVRDPVTPERVSPVKPSEALRLGRLLYPVRIEGHFRDEHGGACALGAIAAGMNLEAVYATHWHKWTYSLPCPACGRLPTEGSLHVIAHLNDDHHWSDDQIVAYLEGLGL